jgi:hypothetical protein
MGGCAVCRGGRSQRVENGEGKAVYKWKREVATAGAIRRGLAGAVILITGKYGPVITKIKVQESDTFKDHSIGQSQYRKNCFLA